MQQTEAGTRTNAKALERIKLLLGDKDIAIATLQAQIDELEAEVATLKSKEALLKGNKNGSD